MPAQYRFAEDGRAAMQYATTEGWGPLREWIAQRMRGRGVAADPERVIVTTGSQQGIDLVGKVFRRSGRGGDSSRTRATSRRSRRSARTRPRSSASAATTTACAWTRSRRCWRACARR